MIRRIAITVAALTLVVILAGAMALYRFVSGDGMRQALEQQASAWLGEPVQIGAMSARLLPRPAMTLQNVTVGQPHSLTLASIAISTDLRALIGRRLENAEITVADSRIQMPLPVARRGAPAAESEATAAVVKLVSIRSISVDNVVLLSRDREIVVDAESSLEGTRLVIRRLEARGGGTALEAEGEVELEPRVDARMRVRANLLDVDELMTLAHAFTPDSSGPRSNAVNGGPTGSRPPPRIAARVSAERARAAGVEIRQFATDVEVDGDRISLSPLTFQLFGGRYQGALTARLGNDVEASLQSRIVDLDVSQLAAFGGVPGAMTGTLTGAGRFSGRGRDLAAVLANAQGEGTTSVVNGTIQRLNLLRTVVLFFGRPEPGAAPAADSFERLDVRFGLGGGHLRAEALALHSDDADIVGSGMLDLASKDLTGQLDVSLSEALSAQAGSDLRRYTREGNRVVLPARLGGRLGQPTVTIDAAAALERGLRNEVQRRLGGLLEGLGRSPN